MIDLAARALTDLVTFPYRRGAETLAIPLGPDAGGATAVAPYDFKEYRARYDADPAEPKYVLFSKVNLDPDPAQIEVAFSLQGAERTAVVKIPGAAFAGTSYAVPLPAADASLRLLRIKQLPVPLPGAGADNWGIVALLGNVAKLAWVLGWEKDCLRRHLEDVYRQRHVGSAHSFSLDAIGLDLRVPRFPAREHSFDPNTVALYHLNEAVPDGGPVADETKRFGSAGHPGVRKGARSAVVGKFGQGFRFPGPTGAGAIEIPHHADFDVAANGSFTVEAFVKADNFDNLADATPHIVVIKRQQETAGALAVPGWSLSLGSFRGIRNNAMWAISDGVKEVKIFADVNLADGKFHHLAGILDRDRKLARLVVDGAQAASGDAGGIAAVQNAEILRVGAGSTPANQFAGVIDEIRWSNIARSDFHPVLGEGDSAYRQRLGIFRQWQLPSPAALSRAINGLVQIGGQTDSFVLIEKDRPSATAGQIVRIVPDKLGNGETIDRDGDSLSQEGDVAGLPEQDAQFAEIYLVRHDDARVDYGNSDDHHRMQVPTRRALNALLALLSAGQVAGKLVVDKSFDRTDPGLHRVGRALLLRHQTLAPEVLGVFVHRARFDFVRNDGASIYASVALGEKLEIVVEPPPAAQTPPPGGDVLAGNQVSLHVDPGPLPDGGRFEWTVISCGAGRARFGPHPADPQGLRTPAASRPRLALAADAPGEVMVRVEYTFHRQTLTGTRPIVAVLSSLGDQKTVAANGDTTVMEADAAGGPEPDFNPIYLIAHPDVPSLDFGADPNGKRMQIAVEKPLDRLAGLLTAMGTPGKLKIVKAFDPADGGLHKTGRAVRLQHDTLDPGKLAALAPLAGFDFTRRDGAQVYCSVAAGEKIEIARGAPLAPLGGELTVGVAAELQVRFTTLPQAGAYSWSVHQVGRGSGSLDYVMRPKVTFTPQAPGFTLLNATYLEEDPTGVFPYSFEVRLKDSLNKPDTIIPKHQYDLLMNILSYLHPIGVEVVTRSLREHVVELKGSPLNVFPGYTYPDFKM